LEVVDYLTERINQGL